ncbi:hypothetical protein SAMN04488508_102440 [Aquimarina spongiae]|uniref:Uncharacterized protein n=1 Tax=Aquimarina spongiae TaxID=570521 RepID=A0A1M6D4Z4_9FLAO|nr:hypothetical protein SAMN04488508_102440 [Aquimarina spongiae]
MKRNEKKSSINLKKMKIAQITNLSYVQGGRGPNSTSNHIACTFFCIDHQDEPQV